MWDLPEAIRMPESVPRLLTDMLRLIEVPLAKPETPHGTGEDFLWQTVWHRVADGGFLDADHFRDALAGRECQMTTDTRM